MPTPSHTIDHYSVLVGQPGEDAFITGDVIHSPIQGKYPELGMRADYDSRQAGRTRRKVFDRFCDTSTIMCVVHFPSPSTGRVRRWSDRLQIRRVNRKPRGNETPGIFARCKSAR
jgi:glyoxylase-like metal-dependent hydrolase (beta-lactamase superfamily II)